MRPQIAIVGMGCRFPGSPNLADYWKTICEGRVCNTPVPAERWTHSAFWSPSDSREPNRIYAKTMACVEDIRSFAPAFFGISPRRARIMDPQQRLFLDAVRVALEDAGYARGTFPRQRTGVFAGGTASDFLDILTAPARLSQLAEGEFGSRLPVDEAAVRATWKDTVPFQGYTMVGGLMNMVAANVSQCFDFGGTSFTVDAACSSALVALHEAVWQLRAGLIDAAVVGGSYFVLTPDSMIAFSRIGALSESDVCRPYDKHADGFVIGEGVGAVILRRLDDAIAAGDRVYAVVRGIASNSDGKSEGPMTPRHGGQLEVLRRAYQDAGVEPHTIGYLEGHGTATPVGDATEISAFRDCLGGIRADCPIGSVKANIGHSLAAAGVASLIKAVLMLQHRTIPPLANYEVARPELELESAGLQVPTTATEFRAPVGHPRRVGVNSFGFGGTNVHVVLEEPPAAPQARKRAQARNRPELCVVSAPNQDLLARAALDLADSLSALEPDVRMADIAYTLARRRHDSAGIAIVASDVNNLTALLRAAAGAIRSQEKLPNGVYIGESIPPEARQIALLFPGQIFPGQIFPGQTLARTGLCRDLYDRFPAFRADLDRIAAAGDHLPASTQPATVAVALAMARFAGALGVAADMTAGYALGELTAAAAAGLIGDEAKYIRFVAEQGQMNGKVHDSDAGLMAALLENLPIGPSRVPVISAIRPGPYPREPIAARAIFLEQTTSSADFAAALECCAGNGARVFVQVAGGSSLAEMAAGARTGATALTLSGETADDCHTFLGSLGRLYTIGVPLDLAALYEHESVTLVSMLPPSLLETRALWPVASAKTPSSDIPAAIEPIRANAKEEKAGTASVDDSLETLFRKQVAILESTVAIIRQQNEILSNARPSKPPTEMFDAVPAESGETPAPSQAPAGVQPPDAADEPLSLQSISEIESQVVQVLSRITAHPADKLTPSTLLAGNLGMDSLMMTEMISAFEERFPKTEALARIDLAQDISIRQLSELLHRSLLLPSRPRAAAPSKPAELYRYELSWEPAAVRPPIDALRDPVAIVGGPPTLVSTLRERIQSLGAEVFACAEPDENLASASTVLDLCAADAISGIPQPKYLTAAVLRAMSLAQTFGTRRPDALIFVHGGLAGAGLPGFAKTLAREWPETRVLSVALEGALDDDALAESLIAELRSGDTGAEVRYRPERMIPFLRRAENGPSNLPDRVVVAISGGKGGLGSRIARALCERFRARVILLGRGAAGRDTEELTADLRRLGGEAAYIPCDVRDAASLAEAFAQGRRLFGPIQAAVHAAGLLHDAPVERKQPEDFSSVFETKAGGAISLWQALSSDPLTNFLILGSWSGRFGNAHQSDYSAGNAAAANLCEAFAADRPGVRALTLDLPPWEGSPMLAGVPPAVRNEMLARGVIFLNDDTGLDRVLSDLAAAGSTSGEALVGGAEIPDPVDLAIRTRLSLKTHPFLDDHRVWGRPILPFAAALELLLEPARQKNATGKLTSIVNATVLKSIAVDADGTEVVARTSGHHSPGTVELLSIQGKSSPAVRAHISPAVEWFTPLATGLAMNQPPTLTLEDFYTNHSFHGPGMRALDAISGIGPTHVTGKVNTGRSADMAWMLACDGALQACAYWAVVHRRRIPLPIGLAGMRCATGIAPLRQLECRAALRGVQAEQLECDIDLLGADGTPVMQLRGLRAEFPAESTVQPADASSWRVEEFPEVKELRARIESARAQGVEIPYFRVIETNHGATCRIDGRECINYTSYNYAGLSGHPRIAKAVDEAVRRYGTSVSASRVTGGQKPIHDELEREIAGFLGTKSAIAMVGGHACNVAVIGHIVGPPDLVLHDSLAHDSILAGARLSGARRRPFPHNNYEALRQILAEVRQSVRRVVIAVEGVYSMDGDIAPLPEIIEIKKKFGALLFVDEAHSLGVLGATGRGVGEYFGVDRNDVDFWMGTLSKTFASCGGFIAGSSAMVDYLKYSLPGFIYSVGITPANAAASLTALRILSDEPERARACRNRAKLLLELIRKSGLDTGEKADSAVVPCIVGNSLDCLRLAEALLKRGINVHPIVHPAVAENMARLRFFVTSEHTTEQLHRTAEALTQEVAALRGQSAASHG